MFEVTSKLAIFSQEEIIIVGLFENKMVLEGVNKDLNDALEGKLSELIKDGDLKGKAKEISKIYTLGQIGPKRIYTIGLGNDKKLSVTLLRECFGKLFKEIQKNGIEKVTVALDTFKNKKLNMGTIAKTMTEALSMATYTFNGYKTTKHEVIKQIENVNVITDYDDVEINEELLKGFVYGKGVNTARTLVNTPGNLMTATDLADVAITLAKKFDMKYEILEKADMEKLGMGALLAVNKGSLEPPKMIILSYQGKKEWNNVISLVGKGITFDTGGYSIKSKEGIVGMKTDMGGAAAVLGAMEIIGELKPKQNVVAVIPATDNMISGDALKPDDVITSMNGKTIEVLNTDAEGRLALADAITYAKHLGANYIIDIATLTGGAVVALGDCTTAAMTNNEEMYEDFLEASADTGELVWLLPLFDVYKEKVKNSRIADLNNSPGREAHAIMGGAFIGEFAEDTPWIHLDIAGTATTKTESDLGLSGATGVMVRTLTRFVERMSEK